MKKRLFIIAMVLLFVINIAAFTTMSYNRWLKPWPRSGEQWDQSESWQDLQTHVALNAQQSQKMRNQRFSFEQDVQSLRQSMWKKRNALMQEARNPSPDLNRIDTLIEEIGALQMDIQKKSFRNILKDKTLLTPGQQEKYFSLFEEHMGRGGRRLRIRGKGKRSPGWERRQ